MFGRNNEFEELKNFHKQWELNIFELEQATQRLQR